jgi:predicted porin
MATTAMAKPEVRIGGFFDFQVGMTTQDTDRFGASPGGVPAVDNERGYGFLTDNEVIVRVSDKLDNGLAWSLKLELEANTDDGQVAETANTADEAVLTLSGTWGQVFFGAEDGPEDTMKTGGKRAIRDAGTGGIGGDFRRWVGWDTASSRFWSNAADARDTSDANKIAYITPRFAGIQAGVSFSPDRDDDGRYRDPDNNNTEQSFWEFGLNYDQKFGDFRVNVAGVLGLADNENTQLEDTRTWHVGAMVGYAGFTVGAGYGSNEDSRRAKGATNTDVDGWDVGVGYNMGAWDFGVGYYQTTVGVENSTGENKLQVATVGVTYDLGNGLSVYAEGVWFDGDSATGSTNDNDGYALITGIGVEF